MTHRLCILLVCVGCADASIPSEDSGVEVALTGGVTLKERSVPGAVTGAMDDELFGASPSVRRFDIKAPSGTSHDDRVRGAVEGLFHRTRLGGHYSVKEYCAKLEPAETEAVGCAAALLEGAVDPGHFDQYLEDWSGDFPEAVTVVRDYLAARGTASNELALHVPVGHCEDDPPECWIDYTARRAILFDATASQVVVFRYYSTSSP